MTDTQHAEYIRRANVRDALILAGICVVLVTAPTWAPALESITEPVPVMIRECGPRILL